MPHKKLNNNKKGVKAPLPLSPVTAVQHLIRVSQSLLMLAEKETQALLTNDMLAFSIIQYEKEKLAADYAKSSENFRGRLEEFRNMEPNLLARLEKLQRDLAEKASGNNLLVDRIRKRVFANAQKGLQAAQNARVRFAEDSQVKTEGA
jgi:hypothetical protein